MTPCGCDKDLLLEYAIGEIDQRDVPIIEAQLRTCSQCAADLKFHRKLADELADRPTANYPDDLREVLVRSAIQIRKDVAPAWGKAPADARPRFSWVPLVCASAGLAIVAVFIFFLMPGGSTSSMDDMVSGGVGRGATALEEIMQLVSNLQVGWQLVVDFLSRFSPVWRALQASLSAIGIARWTIVFLTIVAVAGTLWRMNRSGPKRRVNHV